MQSFYHRLLHSTQLEVDMTGNNHHVILRSLIKVTTDGQGQHSVVQHAINQTIEQQLMPMLSKLFSQHVPHDVIIHLDKLVVDVKDMSLHNLSKQLPHQIERSLIPVLKENISKVIHHPNPHQIIPLPEAKLQAISYYLSEGNFAWWMTEYSEKQIEKIYLALMYKVPQLIEQLWHNLDKKEKATQRFITRFSKATVEQTLALFLKQPIKDFTTILAEVGLVLQEIGILTDLCYSPQAQLLSVALLGIINQQGLKMDRICFLAMLCKQVATQKSISYEKILARLHAYYEQTNSKHGSSPQAVTTKMLVLQLYDLVSTPPICWNRTIKNQEHILKQLDSISNGTIASYQLLETINSIHTQINQPAIGSLVRSWLREEKNRARLIHKLPDELFISFVQSIEPSIAALCADLTQILTPPTAATPIYGIKEITLAFCAFEHDKVVYCKDIQSLLAQYFPASVTHKQELKKLLTTPKRVYSPEIETIIRQLVSVCETMPLVKPDLPQATTHQSGTNDSREPQCIPTLQHSIEEPICQPNYYYLKQREQSLFSLENVVAFLINNELPEDQQVPAYLIAKSLGMAEPKQIRHQLALLCQESTILKKLIQHATEVSLRKLFEAFIPFSDEMLAKLETVITQTNVLQRTEHQTNTHLIKEILIAAAIAHRPPTTEKQYLERILMYLVHHTQCSPITLCDQLAYMSKQAQYNHLAENFSLLKNNLSLWILNSIDEVDLMLLPVNETLSTQLNKEQLTIYYTNLLPAIKSMGHPLTVIDSCQEQVQQLVMQYLPKLSNVLTQTISTLLTKHIVDTIEDKRERITQRWHLFLHTGALGNYENVAALFKDAMEHATTFSLEQVVAKTHIRQRLLVYFTHTQLLLLVQKHSHVGKELTNYLQGGYQLWCATQGLLGQQVITKKLFWDVVLETLPLVSIPFKQDDWIAQAITKWSSVLGIGQTTLLQAFKLVGEGIPMTPQIELLTISLHNLQENYQKELQKQATKNGCKEERTLEKLYLLLNGGCALFSERYTLTINELGHALVQLIACKPSAVSTMLMHQDNKNLVARGIVHYFSQDVVVSIITLMAKEKASFVMTYLRLLSNPPQYEPIHHLPTWNKELSIAIIDYLITTMQFEEAQFLQHTLLNAYYAKEDISKIIASVVGIKSTNKEESMIITLLKPLIKMADLRNTPTSNPTFTKKYDSLLRLPEQEIDTLKTNKKNEKKDLQEQEIRFYTQNTGLIFLWPFLYDFFKAQNLMVDNQFSCVQAAHNAVYLLQYLVTGKLQSLEWQLTLPKLLCGLSYDEVLLPYCHIAIDESCDQYAEAREKRQVQTTQKEQEYTLKIPKPEQTEARRSVNKIPNGEIGAIESNSQLLIEKVLKRWKNLTKLKEIGICPDGITPDLFKSYFLNRLGILRQLRDDITESSYWHLTIMHQDHDSLDLLPPWITAKIKLPWMQEKIILFWIPK